MRKKLAPLLFHDEQLDEDRKVRDPVATAKPSASAKKKKKDRKTTDGFPIHSFDTLLIELATLSKNKCRVKSSPDAPPFYQDSELTPFQKKTFTLLGL